ncbi:MAG: Gfo/Idh/MocA family oxidoreductase [Candidatus Nealsonbacteria bacterium]|nr:Gfo/Idh/MocA family oxidoreductase [Candidatus Nealsonbacteria bacterium]
MARANKTTRRSFLQRSAATAGALAAAPYVITSTALGAAGVDPASERVTIGLIGGGGRGSGVFRGMIGAGGQPIAVADAWKNRREKWAEQIKGTPYADFREMLQRDDLDAVCVATTDAWHVHHTVAAARAGKDIYCEKPLSVCIRDDLVCRDVVRRYDRMFQYGTQQRSSAHCRLGCELVRSGVVGEVKEITVVAPDSNPGGSTKPLPIPDGLDYDMWLGPAPWREYCGQSVGGGGWWHDYDYAIGFIAGWGAHPLDILVWGYDTHKAGNWEIEGKAMIPTTGRNNVVMRWDVDFRFANGVKMKFRPGGDYTEFKGDKGWIGISRGGIKADPPELLKTVLGPNDVHLQESRNHGGNFLEAVKTRKDPVSNIEDAVHSDIISHVSDIAIRCGRKVVWDPVKEQFIGDDEANRMLSRAHREPWKL